MIADPRDQERRDSKFATEEDESLKETQDSKKQTEALSSKSESTESTTRERDDDPVQKGDEKGIQADDGPRPLAAIAKENGGDAGNAQAGSESTSAKSDAATAGHAEDKSSESKGTGEQYGKTTGLAADGGNFDATNPGAGREADRKSCPVHPHAQPFPFSSRVMQIEAPMKLKSHNSQSAKLNPFRADTILFPAQVSWRRSESTAKVVWTIPSLARLHLEAAARMESQPLKKRSRTSCTSTSLDRSHVAESSL